MERISLEAESFYDVFASKRISNDNPRYPFLDHIVVCVSGCGLLPFQSPLVAPPIACALVRIHDFAAEKCFPRPAVSREFGWLLCECH